MVTEPQLDLNNVRFRALIQRNGNSCDLYTSETLVTVNPNPTVIIGPAYEVCDDDYDGIGSYNLSTLDETLLDGQTGVSISCLLYTSPSPRDATLSRMPSSA